MIGVMVKPGDKIAILLVDKLEKSDSKNHMIKQQMTIQAQQAIQKTKE